MGNQVADVCASHRSECRCSWVGKIFVLGGYNGSGVGSQNDLASIEEYDPIADSWQTLPTGLLTGRAFGVAGVVNGNFYMIGGESGSGYLPTVEEGVPRPYFSVIGPASVTAGSDATFTVTALMLDNTVDTSYTGTIHFSSSDSQAVLPADATLVDGVGTFTVTFGTAGDQTLTATDTLMSSITGTSGITGGNTITVSSGGGDPLGR